MAQLTARFQILIECDLSKRDDDADFLEQAKLF